jgi:hypothetical protein
MPGNRAAENPPEVPEMTLERLTDEIRALHLVAQQRAREAIEAALACGQRILAVQRILGANRWSEWLQTTGISRTTAWRYVAVARDKARDEKLLLDCGRSLTDLYRELHLIKPCLPGGYSSEVYKRRKLLGEAGQQFDFAFEEFEPMVQGLCSDPRVAHLADSTLDKLDADLSAALARVREIKDQRNAIPITVELTPP